MRSDISRRHGYGSVIAAGRRYSTVLANEGILTPSACNTRRSRKPTRPCRLCLYSVPEPEPRSARPIFGGEYVRSEGE